MTTSQDSIERVLYEQTYEHCKYFKFKSHFFNRRLIEAGFKEIGGKYHDLKGFH